MEARRTYPIRPSPPKISKLDDDTNFNLQMSADAYFKFHQSIAYGRFCEALSLTQQARLKYKLDKYDVEEYWTKWIAYVIHPDSVYTPQMREYAAKGWALWEERPLV